MITQSFRLFVERAALAVALLLPGAASAASAAGSTSRAARSGQASVPTAEPLACHPERLTTAAWEEHTAQTKALRAAVADVTELKNGFRWRFASGGVTIATLAEWADVESHCCPFIDFEIRQPADGGALELTLTGRAGVKEILRAAFVES